MKITWLKRKSLSPPRLSGQNTIQTIGVESGHDHLRAEFPQPLDYDEMGIFWAEDWEGCEKGIGGFFFGQKKEK